MKFYISSAGIKKVTIPNSGSGKGSSAAANRRFSNRTFLPVVLLLAICLPFLFVRIAFLVLESATLCSSLDCIGLRVFGGSDLSAIVFVETVVTGAHVKKLRDELTRALVEASQGEDGGRIETTSPASFNQLVEDMTSNGHDIKAFAFKTKAMEKIDSKTIVPWRIPMILKMERKVQSARQRESIYWHLASHGVPKSVHCLCLKLAEEYAVNAMARSRLPPPESVSRLADSSFHHLVLLTDNVLAASVVISSAVQSAANPEKLVFHIVTDKKTYTPMHAWFATNSIESAVVEVKGLHQYDWSQEVNVGVKEMLEIHHLIWSHYYNNLKEDNFEFDGQHKRKLEALSPSCLSLMNHLRIYIPELFPDLDKIVFLDDDIVVQHDLSSLWELDLNGNVVGAVVDSWCGSNCCPGRKLKDYLNFSNPLISSNFHYDHCAWLYGMNVFDLKAWRRSNITKAYHRWLELNLNSGLGLWHPGALPPALMAFKGHVHPIDSSWHVAGLGCQASEVSRERLEAAAVVHFSGPAKPWLEIGFPERMEMKKGLQTMEYTRDIERVMEWCSGRML